MYLRLVDYILRITTAPVHDSVSIAHWVNHSPGCICVYIQSCLIPCRLVLEGIYVVVVAIIAGNTPGKGLSLYGVVLPSQHQWSNPSMPWSLDHSHHLRCHGSPLLPIILIHINIVRIPIPSHGGHMTFQFLHILLSSSI